jgi:4-hydroxybenzoate polyprenyltransferase
MALFALMGIATDTLPWILLWQAAVISLNLVARPRDYLWTKPIAMLAGILAQLGAAWTIAGPLDRTAWTWTLTVAFNLPMRIEDVRDMKGDRSTGRTTLPLIIGHWPVRIWFAFVSLLLPLVTHLLLFAPADPSPLTLITCDAIMIIMNGAAAALALYPRSPIADRIGYQIHCLTYCAVLACGIEVLS